MRENSKLVAVVIITHKKEISNYEEISLKQCSHILGNHDIFLVCPYSLDISNYKDVIPNLKTHRVKDDDLSTYQAFNQLKLSSKLYKHYLNYRYILFYEPDAFVFKDELKYWCSLNYDYIGAPWFKNYDKASANDKPIGVGNGGFSLRKVKKFYYASKVVHLLRPNLKKLKVQEDTYWTNHIIKHLPGFKIPKIEKALEFAFEVQPNKCYELNNYKLPFGVHAWYKYDLEFWKPFIKKFGFDKFN